MSFSSHCIWFSCSCNLCLPVRLTLSWLVVAVVAGLVRQAPYLLNGLRNNHLPCKQPPFRTPGLPAPHGPLSTLEARHVQGTAAALPRRTIRMLHLSQTYAVLRLCRKSLHQSPQILRKRQAQMAVVRRNLRQSSRMVRRKPSQRAVALRDQRPSPSLRSQQRTMAWLPPLPRRIRP